MRTAASRVAPACPDPLSSETDASSLVPTRYLQCYYSEFTKKSCSEQAAMVNIVLELVAVMQRQKDAPPAMHPPTALRTHHSSLSARESPRQSSRVNDRNGRKTPVVVRSSASAPVQHNLSSRKRGHTPSERRSLPYTFSFDHEDNTREVAVILDAPLAKRARLDVVDNNYDPSSAIAHTSSTLQAGASPLSHDDSPPRIRNTEDAISQSKVSRHSSALPKSRSGSVHDTTELGPNDHGSATNDAGTDVIGKSSTEPTRKNGLVTRHQEPSSIPTNESGETGVNTAHRRKSYTPARVAGEEDGIQNKAEEQTSKVTASQQPAHAGRTVASTKPRNFALAPINFSISDKANPKTLKETRDKFYQSLRETTVVVKYRNQNTTRTFSDKEAADLSNFFFDEMLGPAALKRLRGLIREYNVPTEEGIGPQQLARAEQASMDKDVLPVFRDFFEAFRQEQRNRVFIGSSVYTVHSFISSLTAGKSLEELLARADKRDPQIVQEMEARGYKTSAGVGFKTVVRNYLCDTLDIDHDTLAKSTEPSKVLTSMVSTFGLGILTILPFSFITRVRTWGYARVTKAIELLGDLQPLLRPFATHLEELVYNPIQNGLPICLESKRLTTKQPFLETLQNAATAGSSCRASVATPDTE